MNGPRQEKIDGRYFLVGSARSGTTLLQAMLAAHSRVHSFPETHFFCELPLKGRRARWLRMLRRDNAKATFRKFLSVIGRSDLESVIPSRSPLIRHFTSAYKDALDQETLRSGKDVWVEKTPHHIDFIDEISKAVSGARFIHIVRDGRDVIASQLDAARKSPDHWHLPPIDDVIALWNSDIEVSRAHREDSMHHLVSYEDLIAEPEAQLKSVCRFMGIAYEQGMLEYHKSVDPVLGWRAGHEYMSNVHRPVNDTRLVKFRAMFNEEQQAYVANRLTFGGDARRAAGLVTSRPDSFTKERLGDGRSAD